MICSTTLCKTKARFKSGKNVGFSRISRAAKELMFRQDWPIVTMITALVGHRLHHGNTEIGVICRALRL
jgi:hypothetical protein